MYGITLIARGDASDAFLKRVAETIKETFPQDERMDLALQEELIKNLYLCLLFIHPRAPNLIGLRSPGTMSA